MEQENEEKKKEKEEEQEEEEEEEAVFCNPCLCHRHSDPEGDSISRVVFFVFVWGEYYC